MVKITKRLEVEYKGEIIDLKVGDDIALLRESEDKKGHEYVSGEIINIGLSCFTVENAQDVYVISLNEVMQIIEVEQKGIWLW